MTTTERFAGSEIYDARYYGTENPPRANYRGYGPASNPHWAAPLAAWLHQHDPRGPMLDCGAAFGHLVRELNKLGVPAMGVEWSKWATDNKVSPNVERADARALPFADRTFGTVTSLDLLEHFEPDDTLRVIAEMVRVAKRGALFVHVVGAHNPAEDISRHMQDPTHACHWPLETYIEAFAQHGVVLDEALTADIRLHPVFRPTDWAGRMVALRAVS